MLQQATQLATQPEPGRFLSSRMEREPSGFWSARWEVHSNGFSLQG